MNLEVPADRTEIPSSARMRVIVDNDFSGDPDGLVQLAHHALSPSVDLRLVIGSHLRAGDYWDPSPTTADNAAVLAEDLLRRCGRSDVTVAAGSNTAMATDTPAVPSPATQMLIDEAMSDSPSRLFVCCGGGLTEVALAWRLEPRIANRITLVWIGGAEYDEPAPPGAGQLEYNTAIDPLAAQVIFNDSDIPIWQVPRPAYRQALVSFAELSVRLRSTGDLGQYLFNRLADVVDRHRRSGVEMGETYALGDNPLVLLTALQTAFEPDPSSTWIDVPRPNLQPDGSYATTGRPPIRVFTRLDTRLMFEDLYAKLSQAPPS